MLCKINNSVVVSGRVEEISGKTMIIKDQWGDPTDLDISKLSPNIVENMKKGDCIIAFIDVNGESLTVEKSICWSGIYFDRESNDVVCLGKVCNNNHFIRSSIKKMDGRMVSKITFSICYKENKKNSFINCVAFGKVAEEVIHPGDIIAIYGGVEKNDKNQPEIVVQAIESQEKVKILVA